MQVSWARAAAPTLKPMVCTTRSTPAALSCLATSHGGGGAQVSSPSETSTMLRGPSAGRPRAATRSDSPIGV